MRGLLPPPLPLRATSEAASSPSAADFSLFLHMLIHRSGLDHQTVMNGQLVRHRRTPYRPACCCSATGYDAAALPRHGLLGLAAIQARPIAELTRPTAQAVGSSVSSLCGTASRFARAGCGTAPARLRRRLPSDGALTPGGRHAHAATGVRLARRFARPARPACHGFWVRVR